MTDPIVSLEADRVAVEPGGQASVGIKITNPGTIVEGYRIEVVGEGVSGWAEVLPPEISVYPQQDASAVVVFSPPGGAGAPGGTWPFGVRVRSTEDADASAVVEGDLEIGKVFGLQAKLVPVNSSGRWRGRHVIQVSNWGNAPARLKLTASNPDEALGFMIRPEVVELPLGGTAMARIWVRTKKPFLRGTPVRIPFTVTGEQEGAPPQQGPALPYGGTPDRPTVDGALNQKPILSKGIVVLAGLAVLALGGGIAYALTRPQPAQATFQELGPPQQPKNVVVEPTAPDVARISWDAVDNVAAYTVAQSDNGKLSNSQPVPATDTVKIISGLTPGTKACFTVQAVRGTLPGPFAEPACADLPAPSQTATPATPPASTPASTPAGGGPSASTSGGPGGGGGAGGGPGGGPGGGGGQPGQSTGGQSSGGGGTGGGGTGGGSGPDQAANRAFAGKWFAVDLWTISGTVVDGNARLAALRAQNVPAGLVQSTLYPNATPVIKSPSWILYSGPYDTPAQAQAACGAVRQASVSCLTMQLQP